MKQKLVLGLVVSLCCNAAQLETTTNSLPPTLKEKYTYTPIIRLSSPVVYVPSQETKITTELPEVKTETKKNEVHKVINETKDSTKKEETQIPKEKEKTPLEIKGEKVYKDAKKEAKEIKEKR